MVKKLVAIPPELLNMDTNNEDDQQDPHDEHAQHTHQSCRIYRLGLDPPISHRLIGSNVDCSGHSIPKEIDEGFGPNLHTGMMGKPVYIYVSICIHF